MKTKTVVGLEIYTPKQRWQIGITLLAAFGLIGWALYAESGLEDSLVVWITYALGCAALYWRIRSRKNKKSPRR